MSFNATKILQDTLENAKLGKVDTTPLSPDDIGRIERIISRVCDNQNIAVLSVLITLLVKKVMTPEQDIRLHQANMDGGFSGRGLDERVITPFVRDNNFPHMAAGSGWLTRSLEQAFPYDLNYLGRALRQPQ